ncbi:MAG TPA: hypothetical protein VNU49_03575 [Opitutaceae bacterium]|jgi:hypothetical protein|nr:hypothetical protein [Opitutaceae bacterium]
MSAVKYLPVFLVALAIMLPAKAAPDDISLVLSHAPPSAVINLYEKLSGTTITVADEVNAIDTGISLQIENQPKDAALKIIEDALAKQAGIEIVHEKDGSLSARKIKSG